MTFLEWLASIFGSKKEPVQTKPQVPDVTQPPAPILTPVPSADIDWTDWAAKAAMISSTFEGKGGDYANPTGNFDGAYLTVGLLGLTWKYSNQQPMIRAFVDKYGLKELQKYMPQSGAAYYEYALMSESAGGKMISAWSSGSRVKDPYRQELINFWSSPVMIQAQNEKYATMMGVFAKKMAIKTQDYFHLDQPLFEHYAYWWDQAVLNGTGTVIPFDDYKTVSIETILNFVKNPVGFNASSNRENYKIWSSHINNGFADASELVMFRLAYLRAMKSRSAPGEDFRGTTLMRRGTLALGIGVVNGSKRTYDWQLPKHKVDEIEHPPRPLNDRNDKLLRLATAVGLRDQMKHMLDFSVQEKKALNANYWGIFDLRQHSSMKRFFLFDLKNNQVSNYLCAHGVGSEGSHDDGFADIFSNTNGSKMTSLGIYQASEPYTGKHGLSCRLDGLQASNSRARERAIVIHGADYVSPEFVRQTGRLGRSDGCMAFENKVTPDIVNKLKNGSLIMAFK